MNVYDIGCGDDGTLMVGADGDWAVVESTAQHQTALILDSKGDYKQHPMAGVGAFGFLHDEGVGALGREIAAEFGRDGMTVERVSVGRDGTVAATAGY